MTSSSSVTTRRWLYWTRSSPDCGPNRLSLKARKLPCNRKKVNGSLNPLLKLLHLGVGLGTRVPGLPGSVCLSGPRFKMGRGWVSVPTKSSNAWLMPQILAPRFRPVRNSCSTCGAKTVESRSDQHSSSTVIFGWPLLPDARSDIAFAMIMLIALSSLGSDVKPSTLKNSQFSSVRMVVGRSKSRAYTFSPVHSRSFTAASCASSRIRSTSDSSRQVSNSCRRSLKVGIGLSSRVRHR